MKSIFTEIIGGGSMVKPKVTEYSVCLKDRHQRRRPKAILAALCANCRRTCELAGKPRRGPRKKETKP